MVDVSERKPMGRPKGSGKSDRNDVAVKVDRAVVAKARAIANHRGVTLAEVLTETLRTPIDRAYAKMLRELEGQG